MFTAPWPTIPILARSTATVLGFLALLMGHRAISTPATFSTAHGIVHSPWKSSKNPYIPILGSYMVASSLGILALVCLKEDRALALCMLQSVVTGTIDGWTALQVLEETPYSIKGEKEPHPIAQELRYAKTTAYLHWLISGVAGVVGVLLLRESW